VGCFNIYIKPPRFIIYLRRVFIPNLHAMSWRRTIVDDNNMFSRVGFFMISQCGALDLLGLSITRRYLFGKCLLNHRILQPGRFYWC